MSTETANTQFPTVTNDKIGDGETPTVNARKLHKFLQVTTQFKDWIARRIQDYGFEEGKDFCSFLSESSGGRPAKEYALSLNMAKELSMVERNERGKMARRHFIECERKLKAQSQPDISKALNDPATLRNLLLENVEKVLALETRVKELEPAQEALDRIANTSNTTCITDTAKILHMKPKSLFSYLVEHKWVYKRQGKSGYLAYQAKLDDGLLEHKVITVLRADGTENTYDQVRITPKGLTRLAKLIKPALQEVA